MIFKLKSILKPNVRMFTSTSGTIPRVCIVGAGPAGFYAAMHLTKNLPDVNIDMIEKLPVPFGLIRYGVAPDHPEVKNVINQFSKVAQQNNVNFYGNITLGKDITVTELRKHYHAVLLTYGAEEDRLLGIENEDNSNVVAARKFVGWYNGLPSEKDFKIDLSGHTAAILGQGNVALDVSRILLSPIDDLRKTDIPEHVLSDLAQSKVKEIYLIGRRGPLQVAFTIKELREQLKLKNCRTIWRAQDFEGIAEIVKELQRPRKRLTELMLKSCNEMKNETKGSKENVFRPLFCRSPDKFLIENNKLVGIQLTCNKLTGHKQEEQKSVPTDEKEIINCSLAIRSIGYKSVTVDPVLSVGKNGFVSSDNGRILLDNSSELAKLYVAGWLGTGPVGVILHTMGNAFQVAKLICEDVKNASGVKGGFKELKPIIETKNSQIVDWKGWESIDRYETEKGKELGKPREKICSIEELLRVANN